MPALSPGALAALLAIGLAWALTIPLTKLAVMAGYAPLGLLFWVKLLSLLVLTLLLRLRRVALPPVARHLGLFAIIGVIGSVLPGSTSFWAASQLPAGIMAIVIAIVPIFALPIALALGLERWDPRRSLGVLAGGAAVLLIAAPEASLPAGTAAGFVLIALIAPFCYGCEGNYLALRGTDGLDPIQLLWGATLVAVLMTGPLALFTGQFALPAFRFGPAEWAVIGNALCDSLAYSGYIWLIGRAGAVFASQVAYLVTGFGVLWSMALLAERYPPTVWLALLLMLGGVALVQPRRRAAVGEAA